MRGCSGQFSSRSETPVEWRVPEARTHAFALVVKLHGRRDVLLCALWKGILAENDTKRVQFTFFAETQQEHLQEYLQLYLSFSSHIYLFTYFPFQDSAKFVLFVEQSRFNMLLTSISSNSIDTHTSGISSILTRTLTSIAWPHCFPWIATDSVTSVNCLFALYSIIYWYFHGHRDFWKKIL